MASPVQGPPETLKAYQERIRQQTRDAQKSWTDRAESLANEAAAREKRGGVKAGVAEEVALEAGQQVVAAAGPYIAGYSALSSAHSLGKAAIQQTMLERRHAATFENAQALRDQMNQSVRQAAGSLDNWLHSRQDCENLHREYMAKASFLKVLEYAHNKISNRAVRGSVKATAATAGVAAAVLTGAGALVAL